jgi:YbbR domain-containing protein
MVQRAVAWLTHDWALKLTSLALAILLWTTVRAESPRSWVAEDIEVRVVNNDADWVLAEPPSPSTVQVGFTGPLSELLRTASNRPPVIVRVDEVNDTTEFFELSANGVSMPPGTDNTRVTEFRPAAVRLTFDPVSTRLIPIAIGVTGQPPAGFRLAGPPTVEPNVVRASGARRTLMRIDSLRLSPVDLRDRRSLDTMEMMIDTTGTGLIVSPRTVRVVVPIQPILQDTVGDVRRQFRD